jgi:peptidoglycan/xylan/chitin deacetylase (PgdA/CDA1 family)
MDRRHALRTAAALALGTAAAGCDAQPSGQNSSASPASGSAQPGSAQPGSAQPASPGTSQSAKVPPSRVVLPDEVTHGPRDGKNVALTFHGQGEPRLVNSLLDEIAKSGTRVTVLAVGSWLSTHQSVARRILADGHELGNHTQHHADIKRMSPVDAHAEIADCAAILRTVTGSIGRWFRPSQTQHATDTIKQESRRVGYPTCLSYDVDSLDYTDPGAAAVVNTTLKKVQAGSIVSLHFGHAGTIAAMAPLLDGLRRRGLVPVTMSELMK